MVFPLTQVGAAVAMIPATTHTPWHDPTGRRSLGWHDPTGRRSLGWVGYDVCPTGGQALKEVGQIGFKTLNPQALGPGRHALRSEWPFIIIINPQALNPQTLA